MVEITQNNHLGNYEMPDNCDKQVLVDVGANNGNFTMSQVKNFKLIHFYEPYKPCFDTVTSMVENMENVIGFNEAVYSESNRIVRLIAHKNLDSGSNAIKTELLNDEWEHELHDVNTISLEDVLNRVGGKINYLKIDCETSEYLFLMDKNLENIDYIGIELHWQMGEFNFNRLINHIKKTHDCNSDCNWIQNSNKEVLFKNKKI